MNENIIAFENEINSSWTNIISKNSIVLSGSKEVEYLMGGRATELIEKVRVCYGSSCFAVAEIYGILAADQTNGKYLWVYLVFKNHFWKCKSLRNAYEIIGEVEEHHKLEEKLVQLRKSLRSRKKPVLKIDN